MKRFVLSFTLLLIAMAGMAWTGGGLTVGDVRMMPGSTATISVVCQPPDGASWRDLQCDLMLPRGVSVLTSEDGSPLGFAGGAAGGHTVMANFMGSQQVRYLLYSVEGAGIGEGDALLIPVVADESLDLGSVLEATITAVSFSTAKGESVKADDVAFNIILEGQLAVTVVQTVPGGAATLQVRYNVMPGTSYRDFQCDLVLPEVFRVPSDGDGFPQAAPGNAAPAHSLTANYVDGGMRNLLYSPAGTFLANGILMEIPIEAVGRQESGVYHGRLCNICFSDAEGRAVKGDDLDFDFDFKGLTTVIQSLDASSGSESAYDLSGRKLPSIQQKGIYVLGGNKKVIINKNK